MSEAISQVQAEIERRLPPFAEVLALLQTIPGVKPIAAAAIVDEIGTDTTLPYSEAPGLMGRTLPD